MAQLWGGRFTKETDQLVYNFNASISFDQKFYKEDIEGSIAHVTMLGKQGIISQAERFVNRGPVPCATQQKPHSALQTRSSTSTSSTGNKTEFRMGEIL